MEKENISFDILSKLVSSLINEIDSLKTIIKEALGMKLDEQDNRLIGIGKACGILRRKKSTVYHMVREGKLPHYKVGKMLEFQPSELLAWQEQHTSESTKSANEILAEMKSGVRLQPKSGWWNLSGKVVFWVPQNVLPHRLRQLKTTDDMEDSTKKKGGRPTLPEYKKKTCSVKAMFSPVDIIYLDSYASECGLTRAEYVYRAAMNQETTALLTPEERTTVNELRNIGNNLNQITRARHLGTDVERDIREIVVFIAGILRKVR